ncbi:MAG TPA: polyhydroxyalkanoate synthesis regulator DNA-binding domain-containing protein [Polyangia bacterium]|jgi:polyhydroxyalkanoate synthesis repressor PhaR|nr:polyhydroxyalkanoate synthesis regulator DNA-binding domain-containing protein [Polyangia bacterium]
MAETRIVKRYANRKLYDTQRSRYVTLEQIADMIRSGEDVKIVDNNSKEDLTAITLTQIIFEEEKKQSFLPLSALRNIIQSGASNITQVASQAGERVRGIFKREGGENGEAAATEESGGHPIREFLERSQQTFDDWQKKVDERIRSTMESLSPLSGLEKEVRTLSQRLADLEKRLEERD